MSRFARFALVGALALVGAACSPHVAAPALPQVTGTVTLRGGAALPPGSTLYVALDDVSQPTMGVLVLGEQHIRKPGRLPIGFGFAYDPDLLDPGRTYGVVARVTDPQNRVLWMTPQAVPTPLPATGLVAVVLERVE